MISRPRNTADERGALGQPAPEGFDRSPNVVHEPCAATYQRLTGVDIGSGAYEALKERGRRTPEDFAVVGFDNQEFIAAHLRPPLSTVAPSHHATGVGR
jgi:LacI family transcriptional regulator